MTEPTEPRTWRTNLTESDIGNGLVPEDWPLGPVVVSTVPPDGVAVAADGRMVLLPGVPLPKGLEWRWHEDDPWHDGAERPPVGRPVEVRPVPAPEPATERVPWASVPVRMRTLAGTRTPVGGVRWDEGKFVYCTAQGSPIAAVHDPVIGWDGSGTVEVLRDADPTPTSPAAARRLVDVADDDLSELRPVGSGHLATPTDTPSEDEPRLCRNCLARHRSDTDNTLCDRFDPTDTPSEAGHTRTSTAEGPDFCAECDRFRRLYRDRLCMPNTAIDRLLATLTTEAPDVGGATRDGDRP